MSLSPLTGIFKNSITSSNRPMISIQNRMFTAVVIQVPIAAERPRIAGGMISSFSASNGPLKQPKNAARNMSPMKTQIFGASG